MKFILGEGKIKALSIVLFLQFTMLATVLFDIPIARQIISFIYLTFVPGFIIVRLLRMWQLDRVETLMFSVGFSIAFIMLGGLLLNQFLFGIGFSRPLSDLFLMVGLIIFTIIGSVIICLQNEPAKVINHFNISPSIPLLLILCLPILSIIGTVWMNIYGSNLFLLILIITIALLVAIIVIFRRLIPPDMYPFAVLMISLSLLFSSSLISNYMVSFGSDLPAEYFIFRITESSAHWSSTPAIIGGDLGYGRLNAMLSITILPTIYSSLSNLDPTWIFKLFYPVIFSLVPLGLYKLWEGSLGKKGAFVGAFLFMSLSTFYGELLGLARQMIAELFFVLLLIVIFSKKIRPSVKLISFTVFSVGLVVSHYGLAEIFLFLFAAASLYLLLNRKSRRLPTISMVILFSVILFSWYIYSSNASVFNSLVSFGDHVFQQLNQFLNPASRGEGVLTGLGLTAPPSFWNFLGRLFAYLTEGFIILGFIAIITKRHRKYLPEETFIYVVIATVTLGLLILVPGLANTLGITRFYHILLFFLCALFVLGIRFLPELITKRKKMQKYFEIIVLIGIIIPYFLFQSGFVYQITGSESYSLSLSKAEMSQFFLRWQFGYFDASEVAGAVWLSNNLRPTNNTKIYTDFSTAAGLLNGYGEIYGEYIVKLSNDTRISPNALFFLNRANLEEKIIMGPFYTWNITENLAFLNFTNTIYSDGGCAIFEKR